MNLEDRVKNHASYSFDYQKSNFIPRLDSLRKLEGWYPIPNLDKYTRNMPYRTPYQYFYDNPPPQDGAKIKLSCKWNDIMRAADSKHFRSCFQPGKIYRTQPVKRLSYPSWAVIYLPDRAGNILARTYCHILTGEINEDEKNAGYHISYRYLDAARASNNLGKQYLLISPIYGNQLYSKMVIDALQDIAVVEETGDIYL